MNTERISLQQIAGFCPEEAIWKMLVDVSGILLKDGPRNVNWLHPISIVVDGDTFLVGENNSGNTEFCAPEYKEQQPLSEEQAVWTLGALIYYVSSRHIIFGGRGGEYQQKRPNVSLPALQKTHQALTPLMHQSLCYTAKDRISLQKFNEMAQRGLKTCMNRKREKDSCEQMLYKTESSQEHGWPEKMIEL